MTSPAFPAVPNVPCPIEMTAGQDFAYSMEFTIGGVDTFVGSPAVEIRAAVSKNSDLILQVTPYITQSTPGVMSVSIPASATADIPAGTYWWDMFGTINGQRLPLSIPSPWTINPRVTAV